MKAIPLILYPAFLFGLFIASGCNTAQRFENVSSAASYRDLVGSTYILEVPMHISGVNAPPGYEKSVDYYVINPTSPSWAGPELITRDTLPPGTVITVESVRRCTNCPFEDIVDAGIRISGYSTPFNRPIHIHLKYLTPGLVRKQ